MWEFCHHLFIHIIYFESFDAFVQNPLSNDENNRSSWNNKRAIICTVNGCDMSKLDYTQVHIVYAYIHTNPNNIGHHCVCICVCVCVYKINTCIHTQWWPRLLGFDRSENIEFFASKTWFMFFRHADGCSWAQTNIRWSESYCFYPLLTLIFGMSTFCRSTSLWHSVNIFPENYVIPCLMQLKPKAFLWIYNRSFLMF